MKHLYFVRHGQTEGNVNRIWSGTSETPLTPEGKAQAKRAGQHAKNLGIDHIVCSPLGRAHNTAEIIAKEFGYPAPRIELNSLFIERHFGSMEGRPWQEDMNIDDFIDHETYDTVLERARQAYQHLQTIDADTVLVVSHGSFGRALRHVIHPEIPFKQLAGKNDHLPNAEIIQFV
jgi:broad specificity phosphatase PhoE